MNPLVAEPGDLGDVPERLTGLPCGDHGLLEFSLGGLYEPLGSLDAPEISLSHCHSTLAARQDTEVLSTRLDARREACPKPVPSDGDIPDLRVIGESISNGVGCPELAGANSGGNNEA